MNKTAATILCGIMFLAGSAQAQKAKKIDPKQKFYYKEQSYENDEIKVTVVDIVSDAASCKFKIKVTNKTADYILLKPEEMTLIYDFGKFSPKANMSAIQGKDELIKPKDNDSRVLSVVGDNRFQAEKFSIDLKGFYRISAKGEVYKVPDFKLPATVNDFEAGPFKVLMTNISKETKETALRFKVTYMRDDKHIGIINTGKAVMKLEDGREFAMANQKDKQDMIKDGKDEKYTYYYRVPANITDMQFANLWIVWKDTFTDSELFPLTTSPINIILDEGLTEGKK
jgi:hypothetical protein